jgi:hypothetical protein
MAGPDMSIPDREYMRQSAMSQEEYSRSGKEEQAERLLNRYFPDR